MASDFETEDGICELQTELNRRAVFSGWLHTGLGSFQVNVVDEGGTQRFDRNTLQAAIRSESLCLSGPVGLSDVSRAPAFVYRTYELQILLTLGEISRMALHQLEPAEVLKLRKRFGNFFEIGEDFYDSGTGTARS